MTPIPVSYTHLGGSEDEAYLQKAASYVNDKNMQMRKLPGFSKQSADYQTVMIQLNIADDYFKALEWAEGMERQKNDLEKETYSFCLLYTSRCV